MYCFWEHKMGQPWWKTLSKLLKKLNIGLPYDPAIPLLHLYQQEWKNKDLYMNVHNNLISNSQKVEMNQMAEG